MTRDELGAITGAKLLALVAWGEARGEPIEGQVAVMHVIRNRYLTGERYGRGWHGVMLRPKQFSCLNPGDPNLEQILDLGERFDAEVAQKHQPITQLWILAVGVVNGGILDNTDGANHYHVAPDADGGILPKWVRGVEPVARIGAHWFYRL